MMDLLTPGQDPETMPRGETIYCRISSSRSASHTLIIDCRVTPKRRARVERLRSFFPGTKAPIGVGLCGGTIR
jgi:hypothetical protein